MERIVGIADLGSAIWQSFVLPCPVPEVASTRRCPDGPISTVQLPGALQSYSHWTDIFFAMPAEAVLHTVLES